jgi:hypothetical protein
LGNGCALLQLSRREELVIGRFEGLLGSHIVSGVEPEGISAN